MPPVASDVPSPITVDASGHRSRVRVFSDAVFVPVTRRPLRWSTVGLGLLAVAVAVVVSVLRPGTSALRTIWAEDGAVFLTDAGTRSLGDTLLSEYAGYLHALPRLAAEFALLFPAGWLAAVVSITAATVNAVFGLIVYHASGALRTPVLRAAVAALTVVVPAGGIEVPNSLANLQWAGLYAVFWIALWRPATRAGSVVAITTTLLVGGSSVLAAVYLPLLLARLAVRRDRHCVGLIAALGTGLAAQASVILFDAGLRADLRPDYGAALYQFIRQLPTAFLGDQVLGPVEQPYARTALVVVAGLAGVALVAVVARWGTPNWALAGLAAGHGFALWLATTGVSGHAHARYSALAAMLLIAAAAALFVPPPNKPPRQPPRQPSNEPGGGRVPWPAVGFAVALAAVCAVNLPAETPRRHGPSWPDSVAAARATCAAQSGPAVVELPISPAGWGIYLTCSYLRR